uniref:Putative polyol transporter 1 n=1 Tax=Aegilops tauschii TaxID=37682 RepID=N1R5P2_AEGTA
MSGAQIFMAEDLGVSDTQIELLSGAINIYSLVGALLAGWASGRPGRRLTIVLTNVFFLVGPLIMTLAGGYTALMAGRFISGIGVGYALVIAPIYAAEIAPASSRGLLSSLPEVSAAEFPLRRMMLQSCLIIVFLSFVKIFINTGVMLSYVSNFAFSALPAHLAWRLMFAAGVVPTVFLAAGVLTMPESPRWLAMKGRLDEAKAVLDRTSDTLAEPCMHRNLGIAAQFKTTGEPSLVFTVKGLETGSSSGGLFDEFLVPMICKGFQPECVVRVRGFKFRVLATLTYEDGLVLVNEVEVIEEAICL